MKLNHPHRTIADELGERLAKSALRDRDDDDPLLDHLLLTANDVAREQTAQEAVVDS